MCVGADVDGARRRRATRGRAVRAPSLPRIEYSSSEPCAFTRVARAGCTRRQRAPISTWFANTRSAGSSARSAAAFASTYASRSRGREVLQQLRLQALVPVEHEDRQQLARQLRHDDARAAEVVVAPACRVLADDGHVVAGEAPLARERARVDVRTGAAEEVAVPENDPHGGGRYVRWKYSAYKSSTAGFDVCTVTSAGVSSSASE